MDEEQHNPTIQLTADGFSYSDSPQAPLNKQLQVIQALPKLAALVFRTH